MIITLWQIFGGGGELTEAISRFVRLFQGRVLMIGDDFYWSVASLTNLCTSTLTMIEDINEQWKSFSELTHTGCFCWSVHFFCPIGFLFCLTVHFTFREVVILVDRSKPYCKCDLQTDYRVNFLFHTRAWIVTQCLTVLCSLSFANHQTMLNGEQTSSQHTTDLHT